MATFFKDKKKDRDRQMKERKKVFDGSSSEESGDDKGGETRLKQGLTTLSRLWAQQHSLPSPKQKEI